MNVTHKTVTIIGAGIAGLTAAIALTQAANACGQKIQIQILERNHSASEEGAGLQLSPNVTHILRKLGVLDALLDCAGVPQNIIMADGKTGRQIADIPLGEYAEARYGAPYIVVHRADLHAILLTKAVQQAEINIQYGHEATDFKNYTDLCIAADGVWSSTKKQLGLEDKNPVKFSGHIAWRALIDDSELVAKYQKSTRVWLGSNAHIVMYPIRNGTKLNFVAFTEGEFKAKDWAQTAELDELKQHLHGWNAEVSALVSAAQNMKIWPLCAGKPEYQSAKDNILFIGDAAHPTLPYQAQGAAMAIEDAACLANLLYAGAETWHEWNEEILPLKLRVFEQSRHDRVTKTQQTALDNAKIFHLSGPISWARNFYLRFLTRFARNKLLSRLDWLYSKRYDNY